MLVPTLLTPEVVDRVILEVKPVDTVELNREVVEAVLDLAELERELLVDSLE